MKRKALLILVLLSFACFGVANAQTLFSEDFEDGSMPSGWTTSGNGSWSVATAVNSSHPSNAGHGTYCAQIKHGTTGNATKLITPEIDLSTVTSAELSFMHVEQSWGGDIDGLKVYYRTSPSGTWTQIVEYTAAYASWATEDGIVLPNLSSTYQLAFEYIDNYGYGLGIDYVNIIQGASCPKPASLTAVANGQSAILNWTSDATSFDIAWSLNPNADPDQYIETTGHNATTFTRNDLTIDADYYFWVRANCGADGISTWAGPVSVHIGYCTPAPSSVDNNGISHVTFGTGSYVVDNETPTATYADYHDLIGEVEAGIEASVAITYKTSYTYNTYIWVDLDNDLSFERSEIICQGESTNSNPTTLTLTFTIPATQTPGNYRMRIGGADSGMSSADNANPCYTGTYACFQDYTLRVVEGAPLNFITNITGTEDWNEFCRGVNNGLDYSDKTVTLANDISVTTMVGTENHAFNGTFDGQGNTLTVTIQNNNEQGVAPFHYISNATIQNLIVTGSVTQTGSNPHASGLVGFTIDGGTNTIQNCLVHTNVTNSASSGNRHIGGIIGHAKAADNTIIGCVYDGTLSSSGDNGYKGGLVGWSNESALTLTDCFFVGHNSDGGKFHPIGCKSSPTVSGTVTNCYYTVNHTINDDDSHSIVNSTTGKGVMVYSITGDNGITVAMDGTAANTYTYSGLSLYSPGITYTNDGTTTFYAASGDQVSLTLDGSSDGYSAIPGTLTGDSNPYTLEMGAGNTLIMAGTIDYITEINSTEDWNRFCQLINEFEHSYIGDTVTLVNDITISKMAGTSKTICFQGTFDGQGHTLTLSGGDFGTSSSPQSNAGCAPFRFVSGATFMNLEVTGDIYSSNQKAAGFIGTVGHGDLTFTNCVSSVNIHASRNGDGTHGGFIGNLQGYNQQYMTATFNGCAFTGSITTTNGTTNVGGFVGWCEWCNDSNSVDKGYCYLVLNNCVVNPNTTCISSGSKTFSRFRNESNSRTINNCYYIQAIGDAQGKQAYSITGVSPVTVAMNGTPMQYNLSGIEAYTPGIVYNSTLYAGNGDNVSLNLDGSADGYQTSYGNLTGSENPYTLAMAAYDTEISDLTTPTSPPTKIVLNPTAIDEMTWNQFVSYVNGGDTYEGKTVTLMEDISVTTMVGTTSNRFSGTFDGQGHTITIDYTSTDMRCGVFNTADNATFMNLRIAGTMSVSHFPSGALVGYVHYGCHFINCVSDVEITATVSNVGDRGLGGFLGEADRGSNPRIYFDGCAFTGKLIGNCNGWGGFVGRNRGYVSWSSSNSDIYFTNCMFAPTAIPESTSGCATFARSDSYSSESNSHIHIDNCYYTQPFGTVQGKQAYSIIGIDPVIVTMNGTPTQQYNVSGIDVYAVGMVFNGNIIAGNGEQVAINLSYTGSDTFTAYITTNGSLNGTAVTGNNDPYTLTMTNNDAAISVMTDDFIHAIYTKTDWETFCFFVNNGYSYEGETVTLEADIIDNPVTTTCGLEANPFKGTFEGKGHTLRVNIASSGNAGNAPFKYISGATIENLIVEGTVNAASGNSNRHAGGLVGYAWSGTITIQNCLVSTTVNSSSDYAGGIIGHGKTSNIVMIGSAFTGEIKATGTNPVGGLIGWSDNLTGLTITDCLFAGTYTNSNSGKKFHPIGCTGHGDQISTDIRTISNTYYTVDHSNLNATAQTVVYGLSNKGKFAYTITGVSPVTVAMSGTPTPYNVSGITAYTAGIVYGGNIYAGEGDNVSLTLNGSNNGYQASYGNLTGSENPYTLTMAPHNTEISDLTTPAGPPTKIVLNPTADDEMTWEQFASYVIGGETYEGRIVILMEDISVTTMVGTTNSRFSGTFDGQGHTITIDYTSTSMRCGVFNTADNATFMNLRIDGTMSVSHFPSGALVGYVHYGCHFINCVSEVEITATESNVGDRGLGGFLGEADRNSNPNIYFDGCAFTGKLIGDCNGWGGFVGRNRGVPTWSTSSFSNVYFTNCVFAPASIPETTTGCATFARSDTYSSESNSHVHIGANCYYTTILGQVQGKQAYSITSFETNLNPVTVELYGEHTYYDVSDIDSYAIGIVYNGTIYAGNGDNVSLALEGSPSGAYAATYGIITGTENPFTLAMVAHDTEISALTCPAPTELVATATSNSAVLNWNGISDHYNLQLHEAHFFESFEEDLSQWTIYHEGDSVSWEWGIENPHDNSADLNAHSGNYAAVSYSDFDIHADNWLVSPQILFPNQSTLKFWIMRSTYDDALDEYEVRLSTTGNAIEDFDVILKEKTAANSEWTEVSIDLSAYDGQQGYIAIRHDYTGGFFIMVDDFGIYGWSEPISVTGNTYTVENLLPNTYYRWQVQADCGDEDGVSFWTENNFTTLIACPVPFDLTVSETTANGATIAWTGYSESYNVWVGQLEMAAINYDFEDNTISTDFTNSTSYPWTVTSNDTHAGTYSVKSGGAGIASATSDLNLEVTVEHDATLSFWARISSEASYDKGYFSIDGVNQSNLNGISGNGAWINYTYTLEAGSHTLRWYYSKDSSVNSNNDCFYVDDITIESSTILSEMNYTTTESPLLLNDASNILPETTYLVKVKGICDSEETDYSEGITFTTLGENTKIFVIEGDWSDGDNWVPVGVPSIDDDVILRAEATVFDIAEANIIAIDESGALIIEDGGQLKTNADVEATMKKFIIGYGSDYVETNNGYYLMTLPIATPIAAADAGLITEESDYDLYGWDRTATDEEWQNNHDGIDLQNGIGYLYANRDDMEMSFTATLRNSGEPVVVTPAYDEVEHGGWNLFGNPFPCEAYITTEAEGMTFYRLVSNELVPIEGAIAPLEAFFVKATSAGQTFTISREAPAGR